MIPAGRQFFKMSGSGNDFVVVDARNSAAGELERPEVIQAICAAGTGIGADGVVFVAAPASFALGLLSGGLATVPTGSLGGAFSLVPASGACATVPTSWATSDRRATARTSGGSGARSAAADAAPAARLA